ncbi:unnamed protein product [Nippostrongylus brasiliensis]|uniref:CID domain-containing protein n=1 Tax=Nippostrongylus brasiliensis TaxID=27835 RepID=A0A0N4YR55_NIPBR|nr:unnamed protein product [Nippostrongylus brasiliensis]
MLMTRERSNPLFRFLFELNHPTHVYYRWRLFSISQGDTFLEWRREKFRMFEGGSWWQPPIPQSELFSTMPRSLHSFACTITEPSRWLPKLDGSSTIGDAMVWCADHATCAREICECIYESLTIDETPLHKKIARLYLISDLLANAASRGVRDVFYFRQYFGELLTKIFSALGRTLRSVTARLKAEQFKQRVMLCFRAWEESVLYPTDVLVNSQNIFLGLMEGRTSDEEEEDLDGAPCDIDGVPIEDTERNMPIFEDDSEPTSSKSQTEQPKKPAGQFKSGNWSTVGTIEPVKSKWEDDDAEPGGKEPSASPLRKRSGGDDEVGASGRNKESEESDTDGEIEEKEDILASAAIEEEKRKLMREVEVKVMALQDELESKRDPDITAKGSISSGSSLKVRVFRYGDLESDEWQTSVVVRWPLPFLILPPLITCGLVLATLMDFELNVSNETLQVFLPDTMQSISDLKELMAMFPPRDAQRDSYSVFGAKFASIIVEDVDGNAVSPPSLERVAELHRSIVRFKKTDRSGNAPIVSARALRLFYLLETSSEAESWIDAFLDHMADYRLNSSTIYWTSSKSLAREMERNGTLLIPWMPWTALLLLVFCMVACSSKDVIRSQPWIGFFAMLNASMSTVAAVALLLYLRYPFLPLVFIMPFLVVSIGTDNMFLMLKSWRLTREPDMELRSVVKNRILIQMPQ